MKEGCLVAILLLYNYKDILHKCQLYNQNIFQVSFPSFCIAILSANDCMSLDKL